MTEIELRWREKEVAKLGNKAEEANRRHCPLMDEGGYEKIVLFENLNPDEPVIEAHSFNEAIAKSLMDESLFVDKHPEKRLKSSFKIALGNILKFRKKNWQFDIIGGVIYFVLAFLMFPQCKLDYLLRHDSFSGHLRSFFATVLDALLYVLDYSYVSFLGAMLLLLAAIMFVPPKVSRKR